MGPAAGQGPSGADLIGLGAQLAVAVVVPLVLGLLLDGVVHTGPVFLLVGLCLGIAAAVALVYTRYIKRYQ